MLLPSSHRLCLAPFCPRKAATAYIGALSLWWTQGKAATRLFALCVHLCLLLLNSHSVVSRKPFVLGGAKYPLPNVFQGRGGDLFHCNPEYHYTTALVRTLPGFFPALSFSPLLGSLRYDSTIPFLFLKSQLQISHLSCSLPPIVQIIFLIIGQCLSCSKWFDVGLARLEGQGKLRVPLLLPHLNLVILFLIHWRTSILFSVVATPIYITTYSALEFLFFHILINNCYF